MAMARKPRPPRHPHRRQESRILSPFLISILGSILGSLILLVALGFVTVALELKADPVTIMWERIMWVQVDKVSTTRTEISVPPRCTCSEHRPGVVWPPE